MEPNLYLDHQMGVETVASGDLNRKHLMDDENVAENISTHFINRDTPPLHTTGSKREGGDARNVTLFTVSEMLMKAPAQASDQEILARNESVITTGFAPIWSEAKEVAGLSELLGPKFAAQVEELEVNSNSVGSLSGGGGDSGLPGNTTGDDAPNGSAKPTSGGIGNDWAGSMPVLLNLTRPIKGPSGKGGMTVGNNKRDRQSTASGNISDHWKGHKGAYAEDLSGPVANMDQAAKDLMKLLGVDYNGKSELVWNKNIDGYRVQVLYRTMEGGDHFDHIHIGVESLKHKQ